MFIFNINMKINTNNYSKYSWIQQKHNNYQTKPMPLDTVSFSAMKKSQFNGIDLYVVNRFKAPIEKFNSNEDFQNWCLDKAKEDYSYDNFRTSDKSINKKRKEMINKWQNYIQNENDDYNNSILLMAMQGATKHLKPKNHELPLSLNKGVLAKTIFEIKQEIEKRPNIQFDFNKLYSANLSNHFIEDEKPISDITGWVIIPSKKHDIANFKDNVEKVRALSNKNWCTKTNNALPYLAEGDFHIYLENGEPKLGVRFSKDKVREVQGELNNGEIPIKYADIVFEHIKDCKLDYDAQEQIENLQARKQRLKEIKFDLADAIKNNDVEEIFSYFGVKVEKEPQEKNSDDNQTYYSISKFNAVHDGITFNDLDIDENKLFERIKKINGNADFAGSEVTDLGVLESIIGDASFENSKIKDLKNLRFVGGDANFKNSNVRYLGDLFTILGNADFENSIIESLSNIKNIGGNARLNHSKISDLGALEKVGGCLNLTGSKVTSYKNLHTVKSDLIDVNGRYTSDKSVDILADSIYKIIDFFKKFKK